MTMPEVDPHIIRLLEEVLESHCTAEEACRDHPELLPRVREWLEKAQSVDATLEAVFPQRNHLTREPFPEPKLSAGTKGARLSPPARLGRYEVREGLRSGGYG